MPEPTKIPRPFADSGDKNTIPESSGALGFASWQEGFPAITGTPFSQGGVAPKRADFNGIFNALSLAILWQQQGGFYAYGATTDYEIGNVVEYSGDLYKCLSANGPSSAVKAPTDTTVWSKVMTAADAAALYLPLSGGTMTGTIESTVDTILKKSTTTGSLIVLSGDNSNSGSGANIVLRGGGHASNPGEFTLHAGNGNGYKQLVGKPDGTLTWDETDIFTVGNSPVSFTSSATRNYCAKFANGVMVQCYDGSLTTDSNSRVKFIFSEAFKELPFSANYVATSNRSLNIYSTSTTQIVLRVNDMSGAVVGPNVAVPMGVILIGRWK